MSIWIIVFFAATLVVLASFVVAKLVRSDGYGLPSSRMPNTEDHPWR